MKQRTGFRALNSQCRSYLLKKQKKQMHFPTCFTLLLGGCWQRATGVEAERVNTKRGVPPAFCCNPVATAHFTQTSRPLPGSTKLCLFIRNTASAKLYHPVRSQSSLAWCGLTFQKERRREVRSLCNIVFPICSSYTHVIASFCDQLRYNMYEEKQIIGQLVITAKTSRKNSSQSFQNIQTRWFFK